MFFSLTNQTLYIDRFISKHRNLLPIRQRLWHQNFLHLKILDFTRTVIVECTEICDFVCLVCRTSQKNKISEINFLLFTEVDSFKSLTSQQILTYIAHGFCSHGTPNWSDYKGWIECLYVSLYVCLHIVSSYIAKK